MVEKQPFLLASAQECIFQREFTGRLCVLEMYDFLTFITGTHVLYDGTISLFLENCLQFWRTVISILTPLRIVALQYWDKTNFFADGTEAFEIGSNVLNSVFGDESVMEDSEVWFGFALSRTTASHIL